MLLSQLQSFNNRHFPDNMEHFINLFSIFGGLELDFDIHQPVEDLVSEVILDNYGHFYNEITNKMLLDDPEYHKLLSAIAIGDRRIHSACKRAHISEAKGNKAIDFFQQNGILNIEYSREVSKKKLYPKQQLKREIMRHRISHKVRFKSPFLRFWFYFIAPMYRNIERGEYEQVLQYFRQHYSKFVSFVFEELSLLYLIKIFEEDKIISAGSYWDRQVEIDILARTENSTTIIGECKWTNTKINRSELSKLLEKCRSINLKTDVTVLFSKRGFSKELLNKKSETLQLFSVEDFSLLIKD